MDVPPIIFPDQLETTAKLLWNTQEASLIQLVQFKRAAAKAWRPEQ